MSRWIQVEAIFKLHCLRYRLAVFLCRLEFDLLGGRNRRLSETIRQAFNDLNIGDVSGPAQDRRQRNASIDVVHSRCLRISRHRLRSNLGFLRNIFRLINGAITLFVAWLITALCRPSRYSSKEQYREANQIEDFGHDDSPIKKISLSGAMRVRQ